MSKHLENRSRQISLIFFGAFLLAGKCCCWMTTWLGILLAVIVVLFAGLAAGMALHVAYLKPADSQSKYSMLIQYLVYQLLILKGRFVYAKFLRRARNVKETQHKLLLRIIQENQLTDYGIAHGFRFIDNREEFVKSHSLTSYRDYIGHIKDIREGKQNVLTKDPVVFLSMSSGTTGPNKTIPVTPHMRGSAALYVGPLMYFFMHQKVGLDLKRVFVISYKAPVVTEKLCRLQKGPISSHMSRYMPFAASPEDVFEIANEQAALYAHAVFALQEPEVGHLEGLMSTLVYSFWTHVEQNWKSICEDIEQANIPIHLDTDRDIIQSLRELLRPNKARADFLRREFSKGFEGIARRVWPDLRFARMLTTGGFANHARILREHYMTGVAQISQAHVSSEGFMGFNMSADPDNLTYTAMIEYGFLEFIPVSQCESDDPSTVFAEQVRVGDLYEVVMTTPMGLYRYRSGDIVEIVGFCRQCPIYEFRYRKGDVLNLYWEKTPESALYMAVKLTTSTLKNVILVEYCATEDDNIKGLPDQDLKHYVLFIEINQKDEESRILSKAEKDKFDDHLCVISDVYKNLRQNESIGRMEIIQVKPGSFEELKSSVIEHSQTQQYKVPRILRKRDRLQFLLANRIENRLQFMD